MSDFMPISTAYLPPELHYIIPLAERHGSKARVDVFNRRLGRHVKYGETLSPQAIEALQKLYTEIRAKSHGSVINRWYHDHSGKRTCPPETTWPVYGLLCLFAQLGDPAERYGTYQFDENILDFLDSRITPAEQAELLALGQRYNQDWEAINRWLDEYSMTEHPEARLVYFTGHLLALGGDAGLL